MIVCICNALRERDCREAAGAPEVKRAGCVYRRLGCRVRCGACVATMQAIVEELREERARRLENGAGIPALAAAETVA